MRARSVVSLVLLPLATGCCGLHTFQGTNCGPDHEHGTAPRSLPPSEGETYSCPMHPEVRANFATTCPECGMTLVKE
jgi:hypothetical protein